MRAELTTLEHAFVALTEAEGFVSTIAGSTDQKNAVRDSASRVLGKLIAAKKDVLAHLEALRHPAPVPALKSTKNAIQLTLENSEQ